MTVMNNFPDDKYVFLVSRFPTLNFFPSQNADLAWLLLRSLKGKPNVSPQLWNLARPPATRNRIPDSTCTMLWKILERNSGVPKTQRIFTIFQHFQYRKVIQCALGALSNIAVPFSVILKKKSLADLRAVPGEQLLGNRAGRFFQKPMCVTHKLNLLNRLWDKYGSEQSVVVLPFPKNVFG